MAACQKKNRQKYTLFLLFLFCKKITPESEGERACAPSFSQLVIFWFVPGPKIFRKFFLHFFSPKFNFSLKKWTLIKKAAVKKAKYSQDGFDQSASSIRAWALLRKKLVRFFSAFFEFFFSHREKVDQVVKPRLSANHFHFSRETRPSARQSYEAFCPSCQVDGD